MNQKEFCEIQKQFRIIKYIEEHDSIIRTRPKVLLEEQLFESVGWEWVEVVDPLVVVLGNGGHRSALHLREWNGAWVQKNKWNV